MGRKVNRASIERKNRKSYRKSTQGLASVGDAGIQEPRPRNPIREPGSDQASHSNIVGSKPRETAAYILEMTLALRDVASETKLDFLAYLLDMAAEEADGMLRTGAKVPAAGPSREMA